MHVKNLSAFTKMIERECVTSKPRGAEEKGSKENLINQIEGRKREKRSIEKKKQHKLRW